MTVPGKIVTTKSFDLDSKDETVNVSPKIKMGDWVSVVEKTDNSGHKTVTVKPSAHNTAVAAKWGSKNRIEEREARAASFRLQAACV